jgi:outer membrane immunogenic protein
MKKLAFALAASAVLAGPAMAADMAVKAARPMAAPVVATNWTGCYVSGGLGYQFDRVRHETWGGSVSELRTQNSDSSLTGWYGTVGAGCDYQFNSRWVIGAFGDYTFSDDVRGDYLIRLTGPGEVTVGRLKNDWSWAIGARLGYLVAPNVLTYVNGGFTQTHFKGVALYDRVISNGGLDTGIRLGGQTLDGVFVGTGFEYGLDFLPGLFLRSEGRASWFQDRDAVVSCAPGVGTVCSGTGFPSSVVGFNRDARHDIITYAAKTELVYRFNWGGAGVVAKY